MYYYIDRQYSGVQITTVQHYDINFSDTTHCPRPREECAIFSLLLLRGRGCFISRQAGRMCVVNIVYYVYLCMCVWVSANDGRPEAVRRPTETRAAAYNILVGYYYYYIGADNTIAVDATE